VYTKEKKLVSFGGTLTTFFHSWDKTERRAVTGARMGKTRSSKIRMGGSKKKCLETCHVIKGQFRGGICPWGWEESFFSAVKGTQRTEGTLKCLPWQKLKGLQIRDENSGIESWRGVVH